MERWKELPPITLDDTTISYLVALIPVLVSMTSKNERPMEPTFEDEKDKPDWWPSDVLWRNPKVYMQDQLEKEDRLLVLRKLVHSCYSYHGVEDLLCRLEEMPSPDNHFEIEMNTDEGLEVIELTEEVKHVDCATDSDGPVFVCCFCLEQFVSHEEVNSHQSICKNGLKEIGSTSSPNTVINKGKQDSSKSPPVKSFLGPEEPSDSRASEASDFLDAIFCTGPSSSRLSPAFPIRTAPDQCVPVACSPVSVPVSTAISQLPRQTAQFKPNRKPLVSSDPHPFVPILKTRSQKKLDQIMLKHSMKKKMLKECQEMQAVPNSGAWWRRKRSKPIQSAIHPNSYTSQPSFCARLGLARTNDVKQEEGQDKKEQQEMDPDCQIISVEGPLSAVPNFQAETCASAQSATSPRSSRSLMSQLSRNSEEGSRRRLSFRFLEDEWADKEALEEGRDPMQMSLLSIEFSSPLGIRIRRYVSGEGQLNIVKDPEVFCKTEGFDDNHSKLRIRANDYRITFRKKRRASRFVHKYKFNKSDRREFKRLLHTGLNARSRKLQRQLRDCIVTLKRVPESEIKDWTEGKKIIISEKIIVDDDICITQVDIPESQMRKALAQEKKLATGYKPGPKCFAGLGRRHFSSALNRPSVASHSSPSPPHIPNIFRNRSLHAPSHPYPSPLINLHKNQAVATSGFKGHPFVSKNLGGGREVSSPHRYLETAVPCKNSPTISGMSHLSQHRNLSPSIHNRGEGWQNCAQRTMSSNDHGIPNRRKQQLTHVRKDDVDPLKLTQPHVNPFSPKLPSSPLAGAKGAVSNKNGHCTMSSLSSSSPGPLRGKKLSNFDQFCIRNGKLSSSLSSHGLSPPNVSSFPAAKRQQPGLGPSPLPRQQVNSGQSPFYRSRQLPDWGNRQTMKPKTVTESPGLKRSNQPCSQGSDGPIRSAPVIQGPKRPQHSVHSFKERVPQRQVLSNSKPVHGVSHAQGLPSWQQQLQARGSGEEDVMEVICIDD